MVDIGENRILQTDLSRNTVVAYQYGGDVTQLWKMPLGSRDRTVSVSPQISAEEAESSAKKREMEDWSLVSKRRTRPSSAKRLGTTVTRREAALSGGRRRPVAALCGSTFVTLRLLTVSSGEFSHILTWFRSTGTPLNIFSLFCCQTYVYIVVCARCRKLSSTTRTPCTIVTCFLALSAEGSRNIKLKLILG